MNAPAFLMNVFRHRVALRTLFSSGNFSLIQDYPPGHFYSPIPNAEDVRRAARQSAQPPLALAGIDMRPEAQCELLTRLAPLASAARIPVKQSSDRRYYSDNPFFSFGDGLILTAMLQHFRPAQVIEVGSGFSSAAMLDTNEHLLQGAVRFTFIDPFMDRLRSLLKPSDHAACSLREQTVQELPPAFFQHLGAGDILFIDSSHVAKSGSDVSHLFFEILPRLNSGVIVHVHDIFWPFDYPERWILGGRIWNEAHLLRAFLQHNSDFEVLFFNSYMEQCQRPAVEAALPDMLRAPSFSDTFSNSSIWIRRR